MKIAVIVAMSRNRVIGFRNKIPWLGLLKEDLRRFRNLTLGKVVIMGRKTCESIGKVLPDRINIVISHNDRFEVPGGIVACSIESAIDRSTILAGSDDEVFCIGGSEIYRKILPYTKKIYLTEINKDFFGDTFFPDIDSAEWDEKEEGRGRENGLSFRFITLEKKISPTL